MPDTETTEQDRFGRWVGSVISIIGFTITIGGGYGVYRDTTARLDQRIQVLEMRSRSRDELVDKLNDLVVRLTVQWEEREKRK